jgi:hypothetical protein
MLIKTKRKGIQMRCIVQVELPIEAGNSGITSGKLPEAIGAAVEKWKPEASYFFPSNGKRSMLMVVNLNDASQIPALVEPFFLALNAQVTVTPCMNLDDLKKGLGAIESEMKRKAA